MTAQDIQTEARRWVGTPYHPELHRGMIGVGCDCVGLIIGVGVALGFMPDDYMLEKPWESTGGAVATVIEHWRDELRKYATEIPEAEPGCVVLFERAGLLPHCGIVTEIDYGSGIVALGLVHAYNPDDKVIEQRLDERWQRRIDTCWRFKVLG